VPKAHADRAATVDLLILLIPCRIAFLLAAGLPNSIGELCGGRHDAHKPKARAARARRLPAAAAIARRAEPVSVLGGARLRRVIGSRQGG
jgi:hypothetical protein